MIFGLTVGMGVTVVTVLGAFLGMACSLIYDVVR